MVVDLGFLPLIRAGLYNRPMIVLGTFDHVMPDGSLEMGVISLLVQEMEKESP